MDQQCVGLSSFCWWFLHMIPRFHISFLLWSCNCALLDFTLCNTFIRNASQYSFLLLHFIASHLWHNCLWQPSSSSARNLCLHLLAQSMTFVRLFFWLVDYFWLLIWSFLLLLYLLILHFWYSSKLFVDTSVPLMAFSLPTSSPLISYNWPLKKPHDHAGRLNFCKFLWIMEKAQLFQFDTYKNDMLHCFLEWLSKY